MNRKFTIEFIWDREEKENAIYLILQTGMNLAYILYIGR